MTRKNYDYIPADIESKWQKKWTEDNLFDADFDPSKPKKYVLEMFPYPSGNLHMGHVRNYSIGDVMARFFRMRGYNVLHPMGWDAFGLPAENAAIEKGVHPKGWTYKNIEIMKSQFDKLGFCFDWRREVTTCDPEYYKWEQVMFLKMLENDLAYREKRVLNWCPSCETVLANEEVVEGQCWRCDSVVENREMDQWFLRITKYAEELLKEISNLEDWANRVRVMQTYWIGKSVGAEIDFEVDGHPDKIRVFTTRPDTIYGTTALVLAPEHPLVAKLTQGKEEAKAVSEIVAQVKAMDKVQRSAENGEKLGAFTGGYALHPLTKEKLPIWIANFVLTDYGTGALMAVPGHDERDHAFATKYGIKITKVVDNKAQDVELPYTGEGIAVNSPGLDGLSTKDAKAAITKTLVDKGVGEAKVNYRLRDWGISRQRYWGTPIPVIYCPKDDVVPVPVKDLPVLLPENVEFKKSGGSPLATDADFVNVKCPKCGGPGKRETDTMATFVESSWYYARYCSVQHGDEAVNKQDCDNWLPIDHYIGGIEHATGHLMYFRFFHKLFRDWGWVSGDEPAKQLITQGMVYKDGAKMSKSKGNVVDPNEFIKRLGADTARMFVLFAGPIEKDLEWSDKGAEGCFRFLGRVYRLVCNSLDNLGSIKAVDEASKPEAKKLQHALHKTIKNVTHAIEGNFHYNTAISFMMELVNTLYLVDLKKADEETCQVFKLSLEKLILMLSPFAPHISDELWQISGNTGYTLSQSWPKFKEELAKETEREIVFQINGKIRDRGVCSEGASKDALQTMALQSQKIQAALGGKEPRKIIVVPNKLVNIVV